MSDLELGALNDPTPTLTGNVERAATIVDTDLASLYGPGLHPPDSQQGTGLSYDGVITALSDLIPRSSPRFGNTVEKRIDFLHEPNVHYLKSKVVGQSFILQAAKEGICGGKFKQRTIIDPPL